jgi:hypothetical protein
MCMSPLHAIQLPSRTLLEREQGVNRKEPETNLSDKPISSLRDMTSGIDR